MSPEQIQKLEDAWDMLHFGCDNPDHKEAYLLMASVFLSDS